MEVAGAGDGAGFDFELMFLSLVGFFYHLRLRWFLVFLSRSCSSGKHLRDRLIRKCCSGWSVG